MRITGIEPISSVWKTENLPLIYIRICVNTCTNAFSSKNFLHTLCPPSPETSAFESPMLLRSNLKERFQRQASQSSSLRAGEFEKKRFQQKMCWRIENNIVVQKKETFCCILYAREQSQCFCACFVYGAFFFWKNHVWKMIYLILEGRECSPVSFDGRKVRTVLGCEWIACERDLRESVTAPFMVWNVWDVCISWEKTPSSAKQVVALAYERS